MNKVFKIKAMSACLVVEWLMTKYGGDDSLHKWTFPVVPRIPEEIYASKSFFDQLPPHEFPIHDEELAVLFQLTWANDIVSE